MAAVIINLDETKKIVLDINHQCALLGLKAVEYRTGKQKMRCWLPDNIKKLLIDEHQRPEDEKTHLTLVKYFGGPGTWWFSEFDPEDEVFFGKAEIQEKEFGYTSMQDLRNTPIHAPCLWIERDFWFVPTPLEEV
jgi:hypothetical protein